MNAPPEDLRPPSIHLVKIHRLQNKIPRTTGNFPRPTQFENCTCFSNYCNNKKSYKIITTQIFQTGQGKARPHITNTVAVKFTNVKMPKH